LFIEQDKIYIYLKIYKFIGERMLVSGSHISKASVDILHTLVLLNILAERTVAFLNIGKFVLVLQEKFATVLAKRDGNIWNHITIILFRHMRAQLVVVNDEYFFESHVLKNSLINFNRLA